MKFTFVNRDNGEVNDFALKRFALISGENGVGKTARLDSIYHELVSNPIDSIPTVVYVQSIDKTPRLKCEEKVYSYVHKASESEKEKAMNVGRYIYNHIGDGKRGRADSTDSTSFTLEQMVAGLCVRKGSLLILDEPDLGFHTKLQLTLADVLLKIIVELEVNILLTSKSPYFIEALKRGIDRAGLGNESRFALADKDGMKDEDRLTDIFDTLVEPFHIFEDMDAKELRDE